MWSNEELKELGGEGARLHINKEFEVAEDYGSDIMREEQYLQMGGAFRGAGEI